MDQSDVISKVAGHAPARAPPAEEGDGLVQSQFVSRLLVGVDAGIAVGYFIYAKFIAGKRNDCGKPDQAKLIDKNDVLGKLLADAKKSIDQKTSGWWQSVKMALLKEDLREALDTISDVLEQLKKFDSDLGEWKETTTPYFVLMGIVRRAQQEEAKRGKMLLSPPLMLDAHNVEDEDEDEVDSDIPDKGKLCVRKILRLQ